MSLSTFSELDVLPILTMSRNNAVCNIIRMDNLTIMFDCGWNETFSEDIAKIYDENLNFEIDYIFLSNNLISYIGGLPYVLKNELLKDTKVYTSTPISKLGFYILVDAFISKIEMTENFKLVSENEISSSFLNINEIKFKENIKLREDLLITPLPSGCSIGGCCWKINYKLNSIVYAPQFSINFRYTSDPFPYEVLKDTNIFITDTQINSKIPVIRTVIEKEFKKNLFEDLDKQRSIFIPSDSANINIELLIRIEKLLDEYYANKFKEIKDPGIPENKKELPYKVLVCSHTSTEIIESIKSLIEFLGSSIAQQFYSYNENPFNLHYVQCIKDIKEYHELRRNNNLIVIASFESFDAGICYKLLPDVLTDHNFRVYLISKCPKNSMLSKILKNVKDGVKIFKYEEIKRILTANSNKNDSKIEHVINPEVNEYELKTSNKVTENLNDLTIKKKLFAKGHFPMFAYHRKKKLNEYGIDLNEKEIKLMRSASDVKTEVFESSFKAFLYTDNKGNDNWKNEMRMKIKRQDIFQKASYEKKTIPFSLQAKFSNYDLFENSGMDAITKETIILEIRPKDKVIFIGEEIANSSKSLSVALDRMTKKIEIACNIPCVIISNGKTNKTRIKDNLLNMKYDTTVLNYLPCLMIKDYGLMYDLNTTFLKIKTKRKEIKEISIINKEDRNISDPRDYHEGNLKNKEENLNCCYTKSNLNLITLNREISKLLNEEFFIYGGYITNTNQDFKLYLKKNEIILEGSLNSAYLKIRNCIYTNYLNSFE